MLSIEIYQKFHCNVPSVHLGKIFYGVHGVAHGYLNILILWELQVLAHNAKQEIDQVTARNLKNYTYTVFDGS